MVNNFTISVERSTNGYRAGDFGYIDKTSTLVNPRRDANGGGFIRVAWFGNGY